MARGSVGKYLFHKLDGVPLQLWNAVSAPINNFQWDIGGQDLLRGLIGDASFRAVMSVTPSDAQNRKLREVISPLLKSRTYPRKEELCTWIVRDWGQIRRRGVEGIPQMAMQLGCFQPDEVDAFVSKNPTWRISSWSKLLAFADPAKYAIYDSRNALALNVLLEGTKATGRFYMPQPSGKSPPAVAAVKAKLNKVYKGKNPKWAGYRDYNALLEAMGDEGGTDLLGAEMHLFAHSVRIAQSFAIPAATTTALQAPAPSAQAPGLLSTSVRVPTPPKPALKVN